jgi:hypothetical protein
MQIKLLQQQACWKLSPLRVLCGKGKPFSSLRPQSLCGMQSRQLWEIAAALYAHEHPDHIILYFSTLPPAWLRYLKSQSDFTI